MKKDLTYVSCKFLLFMKIRNVTIYVMFHNKKKSRRHYSDVRPTFLIEEHNFVVVIL
jgi:hypothetical protein